MDDLLLSKIRLAVVAELLNADWVSFSALARAADATHGNLGTHLQKLVDAGYVHEQKSFVDRRPQTKYQMTKRGRDAFVTHVREMQSLLKKSAARS